MRPVLRSRELQAWPGCWTAQLKQIVVCVIAYKNWGLIDQDLLTFWMTKTVYRPAWLLTIAALRRSGNFFCCSWARRDVYRHWDCCSCVWDRIHPPALENFEWGSTVRLRICWLSWYLYCQGDVVCVETIWASISLCCGKILFCQA